MPSTTTAGEPILDGLPICVPKLLLPRKDIDLAKWACVACDQFESEPDYWAKMSQHAVTGGPPEDDKKRIATICRTMKTYVDQQVFDERPPAFMAIDRKTPFVPTRKGLVLAVDLEQYNYNCPVPTLIRPTEKTIVARLPPRIAIREDAPLELPHIIMIIDDPSKSVIEPLFADSNLTEPEYEVELFNGAGIVKGLRVTPKGTEHVERSMKELAAKESAAAAAAGREPAVILIGDGNHSLATAKACWENLKKQEGIGMDHPQRYALVELQNLHDEGVVFEPIHRILSGANADELQAWLESAWGCTAKPYVEPVPDQAVVLVKGSDKSSSVILEPPLDKLPIVSVSTSIDSFAEKHPEVKIGYVHGEEPVRAACQRGDTAGIILPGLDKSRFLNTLHQIGTLPRKAFSMGEANEKRFYVEARNILPASGANELRKILSSADPSCTGQVSEAKLQKVFKLNGWRDADFKILVEASGASCGGSVDYQKLLAFVM